jgi:hypothetical protein
VVAFVLQAINGFTVLSAKMLEDVDTVDQSQSFTLLPLSFKGAV